MGRPDVPYGAPASTEGDVLKITHPSSPQTSGFDIWRTPIASLQGTITPSALHFGVHHNGIPEIDPKRHALILHGMTRRPVRFTTEELLRFPMVTRMAFIECSGNTAANAMSPFARDDSCQDLFGEISHSEWTGIPLRALMQQADVLPAARWCIAEGADGGSHHRSIPITKLLDDAMIALYQNGERLRPAQGYPMRLLLPGWEGNTQVKWLHSLEFTDKPAFSKDESGLYSEVLSNGQIERMSFVMGVKSVITHPSGRQQLDHPHGIYEISGLAWSGHGKVARVDVSADGGKTWMPAELQGAPLDKAFTRFSIPWQWSGKESLLMSRATDHFGHTQPTRSHWKKRYASHTFNHYNAIQCWRVTASGKVQNHYA